MYRCVIGFHVVKSYLFVNRIRKRKLVETDPAHLEKSVADLPVPSFGKHVTFKKPGRLAFRKVVDALYKLPGDPRTCLPRFGKPITVPRYRVVHTDTMDMWSASPVTGVRSNNSVKNNRSRYTNVPGFTPYFKHAGISEIQTNVEDFLNGTSKFINSDWDRSTQPESGIMAWSGTSPNSQEALADDIQSTRHKDIGPPVGVAFQKQNQIVYSNNAVHSQIPPLYQAGYHMVPSMCYPVRPSHDYWSLYGNPREARGQLSGCNSLSNTPNWYHRTSEDHQQTMENSFAQDVSRLQPSLVCIQDNKLHADIAKQAICQAGSTVIENPKENILVSEKALKVDTFLDSRISMTSNTATGLSVNPKKELFPNLDSNLRNISNEIIIISSDEQSSQDNTDSQKSKRRRIHPAPEGRTSTKSTSGDSRLGRQFSDHKESTDSRNSDARRAKRISYRENNQTRLSWTSSY